MCLINIERTYYFVRIWFARMKVILIPLVIVLILSLGVMWCTDLCAPMQILQYLETATKNKSFDVVAIFSAVIMCASAWLVSIIYEGKIIHEHYKVYAQPEMAANLRRLIRLRNRHYDDFRVHRTPYETSLQGLEAYQSRSFSWGDEEDNARRSLKFYFYNALDLYVSGRISYASFHRLVDQSAICVFFDVVEPMECMINPIYGARRYHMMMLFAGKIYLKHKMYDAAINNRRMRAFNVDDTPPATSRSAQPAGVTCPPSVCSPSQNTSVSANSSESSLSYDESCSAYIVAEGALSS